jgi:hypothetical protein
MGNPYEVVCVCFSRPSHEIHRPFCYIPDRRAEKEGVPGSMTACGCAYQPNVGYGEKSRIAGSGRLFVSRMLVQSEQSATILSYPEWLQAAVEDSLI